MWIWIIVAVVILSIGGFVIYKIVAANDAAAATSAAATAAAANAAAATAKTDAAYKSSFAGILNGIL